jgi:5-amino-6-(5-phosphoribosylamino)uracil reductase
MDNQSEPPYTLISSAVTLDGFISDGTGKQLMVSDAADLDRVDALRATCDAILVGATTVREDDPRLTIRDPQRVERRLSQGLSASPVKVTLTNSGRLHPTGRFFSTSGSEKIVYCSTTHADRLRRDLRSVATVIPVGRKVEVSQVRQDLGARGVRRLMIEGGATVNTQFLAADLVDELQLAVAPSFAGAAHGMRFVAPAAFPWTCTRRAALAEVQRVGDMAVLTYALSTRFEPDSGQVGQVAM